MIKQRDILTIAVFSFLTVFVWIVAGVYHSVVTSQITEVQAQLIKPLNPTIDQTTIDMVRRRKP
ncbi:hypothetical protein C4579_04735 [Candidatus Microgenomates bacterium]|nr:MAG: hypothetical protein C4579_04735 [Candidatus Microgenomates bacterium]